MAIFKIKIFSISWSPCGNKLATICKDGFIRVYEPLASENPVAEAKVGPASGSKAARIEWVLNGSSLLVSGFGR
jgi:coronin-7